LAKITKKVIKKKLEGSNRSEKKFQWIPSPLTAKSVWGATSLFAGAWWVKVSGTANNTILEWFQGKMPAVMNLSGSYLVGFFIG